MAEVVIQRSWPDGDDLCVVVKVDDSYPDVVAEAKRNALDAYREALDVTLAGNDLGNDEAAE